MSVGNPSQLADDQNVTASEATVLTIEQLNRQIRQLIEGQLDLVWVQGELSNFKAHTSGHFYFSLKDAKSQIKAVMFRGHNSRLRFKPTDGLEVIVRGRISVYEPRGDYQIVCETMEPVGAGALQKAFEQLKMKLKAEGLFDPAKKRPIPALPRHVAIVTSPTGAAIRDMLNVLSRRNKSVQITLVPTVVQGEAAAPHIVQALKMAYQLKNVDAIIIGRGGGSVEDMWCFNNEELARTIAASPVPLISAVGHEIDFTIADFVADLRAPTPSAAAELVVKNTTDLVHKIQTLQRMLGISIQKVLKTEFHLLKSLNARLIDPKRKLQDLILRNDELMMRLQNSVGRYFSSRKPKLDILQVRLQNQMSQNLESAKSNLRETMAVLDSLSPMRVVERGYSMTMSQGQLVKSYKQVKKGDEIQIQLMEGLLRAEVTESKKESLWTLKKN